MDNEYYGVASTPMEDYLAHYGIRGMKWGVRKALKSGNDRALSRQYAKAEKKLAKLEKQAANSKKYAKRAVKMGLAAGAAGGLAAAGTEGVATGIRKLVRPVSRATKDIGYAMAKMPGKNKVSQAIRRTGATMYTSNGKVGGALTKSATAVDQWGKSTSIANKASGLYGKAAGKYASYATGGNAYAQKMASDMARGKAKAITGGVSNNTIARIGAGAIGAGLAAGAARNAYKAATAKKKAEKFRSEMNKAFAGTKYANGRPASTSKKRRGSRRG